MAMAVRRGIFWLGLLMAAGGAALIAGAPAQSAEKGSPGEVEKVRFFEKDVKPILEASCFKCHGGEAKIKGGLRLTSRAGLLKGGETSPAVSLEHPEKSLLLTAINYKDEDLQMPPKEQLAPEKVAILTKWVQMGALDARRARSRRRRPASKTMSPPVNAETMKFWSYQPIKRPAVPAVREVNWVKTPIDAFILQKLESSGMTHAGPAAQDRAASPCLLRSDRARSHAGRGRSVSRR